MKKRGADFKAKVKKISPPVKNEFKMEIYSSGENVVMNFGKQAFSMIEMTADEAMAIAGLLTKHAGKIYDAKTKVIGEQKDPLEKLFNPLIFPPGIV